MKKLLKTAGAVLTSAVTSAVVVTYLVNLAAAVVACQLLPLHVAAFRLSLITFLGMGLARSAVKSLSYSWHEGAVHAAIATSKTESARAEALIARMAKQANGTATKTGAGPYL